MALLDAGRERFDDGWALARLSLDIIGFKFIYLSLLDGAPFLPQGFAPPHDAAKRYFDSSLKINSDFDASCHYAEYDTLIAHII